MNLTNTKRQTSEDHIKAIRKQLNEVAGLLDILGDQLSETELYDCRRLIGEAISKISPF